MFLYSSLGPPIQRRTIYGLSVESASGSLVGLGEEKPRGPCKDRRVLLGVNLGMRAGSSAA
jgi:hypothetical protein